MANNSQEQNSSSMILGPDSMNPLLPEIYIQLSIILALFVITFFSLRGILRQIKYMPYFGLRFPVVAIFFGPLIFQLSSVIYLFLNPVNYIIVSLIEKIYLAGILFGFFHCLREIVFFESLFKTDYAHNEPAFTEDSQENYLGRFGSEIDRKTLNGRGSIGDDRRRNLQEKLLRIPFDRAFEEEKILNTVFPTMDIQRHQEPLQVQKIRAMDQDIYEVGKVARCLEFCAFENFETEQDATNFRRITQCSLYTFLVAIIMKDSTVYVLRMLGFRMIGTINFFTLLDCFEILITIYVLYNLHIFTLCLQQGIIKEYQPLKKFYWFAFLTFCLVIQRLIIHTAVEIFVHNDIKDLQTDESEDVQYTSTMQINSICRSIELMIFLYGIVAHFEVRKTLSDDARSAGVNNSQETNFRYSPTTNR